MSTIPASSPRVVLSDPPETAGIRNRLVSSIRPLGSLKIAVTSFALAIVLIFIGTLAQVDRDIWAVLEDYFKVWWTWVDVAIFFPRSWFPGLNGTQAVRAFVVVTMGTSLVAALLTWANSSVVRRSTPIAAAILGAGILVSLSSLWYGGCWFPGGSLIGSVMAINLAAAHLTRYRIHAKGMRRVWGGVVTLLGIAVTSLVIVSGHNSEGFQGEPPFEWRSLWQSLKIVLSVISFGLLAFALLGSAKQRRVRPISGVAALVLGVLAAWLWATGEATYLGDSGMRVLWQLILALVSGIVLLVGCSLLFRQRSGVIVLHAGVALMMFGQWFVGRYDAEEQMTMAEGQTMNYGQDIRSVELAVIRRNAPAFPGKDDVLVIPLTKNGKRTRFLSGKRISDEQLPFDVEIVDYEMNSSVRMNQNGETVPANAGSNQGFKIVPARPASGAMESNVDIASGYFRFLPKDSDAPIGTFMLSQEILGMRGGQRRMFDMETVTIGDTSFDVQLRFNRQYKDYAIRLIDVSKDDYLGTSIPRNYSSQVHLVDDSRQIDQELTIWMNNPRRYAGETFYQSGWQQDELGNEYTTLQVVRNRGWMIPYVACMISIVGMGYHFCLILMRFLERQNPANRGTSDDLSKSTFDSIETYGEPRRFRGQPAIVALCVAASVALLFGWFAKTPELTPGNLDLYKFGELPLVYQGRVKPFDTLARNSLRVISDIETFNGVMPHDELDAAWPEIEKALRSQYAQLEGTDLAEFKNGDTDGLADLIVEKTKSDAYAVAQFVQDLFFRRQPAVRWLLDVITGSDQARLHKVIRIYHPQVLDVLGLKRRKGYRYSLEELAPEMDAFHDQVRQAVEVQRADVEQVSLYQKKLLETDRKIRAILLLHRSFSPPDLPALPTSVEFQEDRESAMEKLTLFRDAMLQQDDAFRKFQPPLAVAPFGEDSKEWTAYAAAWPRQVLRVRMLGEEPQPSFKALNQIMLAYLDHDADGFNQSVANYSQWLEQNPPDELIAKPSMATDFIKPWFGTFYRFESFFNRCAPFFFCSLMYLLAVLILCGGWLKWHRSLNQIAFWLIFATFVIHTIALVSRIYISGRPPVTNLYSSAIFIGWGVVLLALVIETFFRNGLASLTAGVSGFATLVIAHKLAGDGDTFEVLQAVLDTQFWLATHVVCITLGYATTFLAGMLGILYVLRGVATPSLDRGTRGELARMMYGTLCFAIFFSFFGTVLGGLWADDSWGRFWGWDPKENGALIIVLWNALILHARWDKMIRDRGLAVLCVVGNIVTAWSWFGVNELGVGLHSYGFTEGRLRTLALTVLAHVLIVLIGCLPPWLWWSLHRELPRHGPDTAES